MPPDTFPLTFYRDNCADREITVEDVARAPIAESRVVFLTGTGLSHEPARAATFAAASIARDAGVPIVVDLDYRADQWDSAATFALQLQTLLDSATLAVGTEEELAAASGTPDVARGAAALFECGIQALVLKRGARGSTVFRAGGEAADVAPFPIDVLNVLGAGD